MPKVAGYIVSYLSDSTQPWTAEIQCFDSTNVAEMKQVASIRFYDSTPPPSGEVEGIVVVNYPLSAFTDIITILRDEDYIIVDYLGYSSPGVSPVHGWGVGVGIAPVSEMQP